MGAFEQIMNQLSEIQEKSKSSPIRVKMNQEYFDRLKWMYEITEKQTNINTIYGIELEIDNSVETYEFVYQEGQV